MDAKAAKEIEINTFITENGNLANEYTEQATLNGFKDQLQIKFDKLKESYESLFVPYDTAIKKYRDELSEKEKNVLKSDEDTTYINSLSDLIKTSDRKTRGAKKQKMNFQNTIMQNFENKIKSLQLKKKIGGGIDKEAAIDNADIVAALEKLQSSIMKYIQGIKDEESVEKEEDDE